MLKSISHSSNVISLGDRDTLNADNFFRSTLVNNEETTYDAKIVPLSNTVTNVFEFSDKIRQVQISNDDF